MTPSRFNIQVLSDRQTSQQFELELRNRFSALDENSLAEWENFPNTLQEVAQVAHSILREKPYSKKDWISDRTRDLISKKRDASLRGDSAAHRNLRKE